MTIRFLLFLTTMSLTLQGCANSADSDQQSVLSSDVTSGARPQAFAARFDSSLIIIAPPDKCFSCEGALLRLLKTAGSAFGPVALFLTAEPDLPTRKLLLQYRLKETGILANSAGEDVLVLRIANGAVAQRWKNPTRIEISAMLKRPDGQR